MKYKIPTYKELITLADSNHITERYDGIYSSFTQIPQSSKFILMINSLSHENNGEWVRLNNKSNWERPDGPVPYYARPESFGVLKL